MRPAFEHIWSILRLPATRLDPAAACLDPRAPLLATAGQQHPPHVASRLQPPTQVTKLVFKFLACMRCFPAFYFAFSHFISLFELRRELRLLRRWLAFADAYLAFQAVAALRGSPVAPPRLQHLPPSPPSSSNSSHSSLPHWTSLQFLQRSVGSFAALRAPLVPSGPPPHLPAASAPCPVAAARRNRRAAASSPAYLVTQPVILQSDCRLLNLDMPSLFSYISLRVLNHLHSFSPVMKVPVWNSRAAYPSGDILRRRSW